MIKTKITEKKVLALLPEKTSLVYVDYRDSLDEQHELIQECLRKGKFDALYEAIDEWYMESRWEGEAAVIKELRENLEIKYDIDEDEAEEITDKYDDAIRELIWDRCDDDILSDLIRNTGDLIAHYDTGFYVEGGRNCSDAEIRLKRMQLKKHLEIDHSGFDADIDMMLRQSSYGGNVLVYFKLDIEDFMNADATINSIQFSDAWIGIIDHSNGSGDIMQLAGHSFFLPYERENVFLEKSIKYTGHT